MSLYLIKQTFFLYQNFLNLHKIIFFLNKILFFKKYLENKFANIKKQYSIASIQ